MADELRNKELSQAMMDIGSQIGEYISFGRMARKIHDAPVSLASVYAEKERITSEDIGCDYTGRTKVVLHRLLAGESVDSIIEDLIGTQTIKPKGDRKFKPYPY